MPLRTCLHHCNPPRSSQSPTPSVSMTVPISWPSSPHSPFHPAPMAPPSFLTSSPLTFHPVFFRAQHHPLECPASKILLLFLPASLLHYLDLFLSLFSQDNRSELLIFPLLLAPALYTKVKGKRQKGEKQVCLETNSPSMKGHLGIFIKCDFLSHTLNDHLKAYKGPGSKL